LFAQKVTKKGTLPQLLRMRSGAGARGTVVTGGCLLLFSV